jgi:hypothetical protein
MPDRFRLLVALTLLTSALGTVLAADPPPADSKAVAPKATDTASDEELLEFLGSVDSGADSQTPADEGSWIDYLSQTDIGKVAKTADPNGGSGAKQAAGAQPPASGDKKDE